ncbi:hypothetical protein PG988_006514 [Apiospora saccharicola]
MHNHAVKMLGDCTEAHWATLVEDRTQSHLDMTAIVGRLRRLSNTISMATFKDYDIYSFVLLETGDTRWVVLCSCPTCTLPYFKNDPLEKGRAIEHFRAHYQFVSFVRQQTNAPGRRLVGFPIAALPTLPPLD